MNIIDSDYIIYKFAFACADEPLWKACDACDEYIWEALQHVPPGELVVILTGSKCFRRDKYPDYKGNRKSDKPEHYEGLREHLVQEWEAVVTDDGYEADDCCADEQRDEVLHGYKSYLIGIDKDLNTFPGWKFNPDKEILYYVSESDAWLFFWCQMIMGDNCDNIKGIPKKGKMAAYKILQDSDDPELSVKHAYLEHYGDDWKQWYDKNYDLLYMGSR